MSPRKLAPRTTTRNAGQFQLAWGSEPLAWAWGQKWSSPLEKLLAIALAEHMRAEGVCTTSEYKLAEWCCCDLGTMLDKLDDMLLRNIIGPYVGPETGALGYIFIGLLPKKAGA